MNQEFAWNQSSSSYVHPVVGLAPLVTAGMVYDSVWKMKSAKTVGPRGVVSEMQIAGGEVWMKIVADLVKSIIRDVKIKKI